MNAPKTRLSKIKEEQLKCAKDPIYFIKNYVRISHTTRGVIPFKLFDFQEDMIDRFREDRFNVVLKSRQLGLSTVTAAYVLWFILFRRSKNVVIIATKQSTAGLMVHTVQQMYRDLPEEMKISKAIVNNTKTIRLENDSKFQALATSSDAARGEAISLLILDEAAHIEGLADDIETGRAGIWAAIYPTLSTGGASIAISTPAGAAGWFYDTCVDAERGETDFKLTKLMWHQHPDRDEEWFKKETRQMSKKQIAQELLCSFNSSGATVVDSDDIMDYEEYINKYSNEDKKIRNADPIYKTFMEKKLWIWEEPVPGHRYLLAADVARGDGGDYSAFIIVDVETHSQVAEYQGKITYDVYAGLLDEVGRKYNNCLLVVENNNIGWTVLDLLTKSAYPNLFYSKNSEYVPATKGRYDSTCTLGFTNSGATRPLLISKLEESCRKKLIKLRSDRLVSEFRTFVWRANGKAEAIRGKNDDLVISFALLCLVFEMAFELNEVKINETKSLLSGIRKNTTIFDSTMRSMGPQNGPSLNRDTSYQRKIDSTKSEMKKHMWIYKG
jgi:hypothetical protein